GKNVSPTTKTKAILICPLLLILLSLSSQFVLNEVVKKTIFDPVGRLSNSLLMIIVGDIFPEGSHLANT
ncbi:unnamed protein product, partial [marine sediment metagenome]